MYLSSQKNFSLFINCWIDYFSGIGFIIDFFDNIVLFGDIWHYILVGQPAMVNLGQGEGHPRIKISIE